MTESLIAGFVKTGIKPEQMYVSAPSTKNSAKFKTQGCHVTKRNIDLFGRYGCDVVFLACHGKVIGDCYAAGGSRPHPLCVNFIPNLKKPIHVLSLISGWDLNAIKAVLLNPEHPKKYKLEAHRIAANPAVAYGVGIVSIDVDPESKKLSSLVRTLLSSVGSLEHVNSEQMDAACATTGAGLAFSYYFTQAMADGAFKMGLARPMANKFAAKIMESAAMAVIESGKHPSELKDGVCGAGGPAIYGIHILDKAEAASGIAAAVEASFKRSQELAGKTAGHHK
jgi:pyrroline-5-carboxylate reductase